MAGALSGSLTSLAGEAGVGALLREAALWPAGRRGAGRLREGCGAGRAGTCESSSREVQGGPAAVDEGMSRRYEPSVPFPGLCSGVLLAGGAAVMWLRAECVKGAESRPLVSV